MQYQVLNIRDFTQDKHKVTDDRPYGGGPGMVMKIEPLYEALSSLGLVTSDGLKPIQDRDRKVRVVLTSAKGERFTQAIAGEYASLDEVVIICGHYEGVDERVALHLVDHEVRIGEYVLTGGEPAAAVMLDAVSRLVPGVLGNDESSVNESHSEVGVVGFPQYTRPEKFLGWNVPSVLVAGNHAEITAWREQQKKTTTTVDKKSNPDS